MESTSRLTPKVSDGQTYVRICQNLEEIPGDIPKNVKIISILGNQDITSLEPNTFKKYSSCILLNLHWNRIENLSVNSFNGLIHLVRLSLQHNMIQIIKNGTFTGLIALERIYLQFNAIHSIGSDTFAELIFHPSVYLDLRNNSLTTFSNTLFGSHLGSSKLELGLGGNNLECNSSLCWLKWAELDGRLTWLSEKHSKPACLNTHTFFDNTCGSKYYLMLLVFAEYKLVSPSRNTLLVILERDKQSSCGISLRGLPDFKK